MNKVLVFGSLNIDYTYHVPHIVKEGETISSVKMNKNAGGKGANQAVALSKAGVETAIAGKIGHDGDYLIDTLKEYGVDTCLLSKDYGCETGKAIIQVDEHGKNSILLFPGTNHLIKTDEIGSILNQYSEGDYLILQNEVNNLEEIIKQAENKGMKICINPSPISNSLLNTDLSNANMIFLNEIEGKAFADLSDNSEYRDVLNVLGDKWPNSHIILTCGEDGSFYYHKGMIVEQKAIKCNVVDTTAAGDTFMGFFVAAWIKGMDKSNCLFYASKAASLAVSKNGAMVSIPFANEVF